MRHPDQFFIVFSPEGLTPPTKTYAAHKEALGIAWSMTKAHPGATFFVMGSMSRPCVASVDGRRMAETGTGSVPQGTTSAVANGETPTPSSAQPGDA